MAAGARNQAMVFIRRLEAQQFGNSGRTGLMDGGANRHLDRFQVQLARLAAIRKDPSELKL
jgi:hypothetical protein